MDPTTNQHETSYRFVTSCHAAASNMKQGVEQVVAGERLTPLDCSPQDLVNPLPISFEDACQSLNEIPRLYCEPDGSFVWKCGDEPDLQVDGVLYDDGRRLLYVELRGTCRRSQFDQLLAVLGHPETQLVFQLTHEGLVLDESQFRRWAERQAEHGGTSSSAPTS